jgi:hypothetical protein
MTTLEWVLSITLFVMYWWLVFTVAVLTFRKGHTVLGILGIFFPFLWLIGAILPAKRGSRVWVDEGMRRQEEIERLTR